MLAGCEGVRRSRGSLVGIEHLGHQLHPAMPTKHVPGKRRQSGKEAQLAFPGKDLTDLLGAGGITPPIPPRAKLSVRPCILAAVRSWQPFSRWAEVRSLEAMSEEPWSPSRAPRHLSCPLQCRGGHRPL